MSLDSDRFRSQEARWGAGGGYGALAMMEEERLTRKAEEYMATPRFKEGSVEALPKLKGVMMQVRDAKSHDWQEELVIGVVDGIDYPYIDEDLACWKQCRPKPEAKPIVMSVEEAVKALSDSMGGADVVIELSCLESKGV